MSVYGESLPVSYQRDIASLFHHSADTMAAQTIPARLAQDWVIVTAYMRNATDAIMDWLSSSPAEPTAPGVVESPPIDDRTPMVIRFDRLAGLAAREGPPVSSRPPSRCSSMWAHPWSWRSTNHSGGCS